MSFETKKAAREAAERALLSQVAACEMLIEAGINRFEEMPSASIDWPKLRDDPRWALADQAILEADEAIRIDEESER